MNNLPDRPDLLLHLAERLRFAVFLQMQRHLAEHEVSATECGVLTGLATCHLRPTVTALAAHCGIQQPTVTKVLHQTQARGWTLRHAVPTDHRLVRVSLTPAGQRLAAELQRRSLEAEAIALARLRESGDLASLASVMGMAA